MPPPYLASVCKTNTALHDANQVVGAHCSTVSAQNALGLINHSLVIYQTERLLVALVDTETTSCTQVVYFQPSLQSVYPLSYFLCDGATFEDSHVHFYLGFVLHPDSNGITQR